MPAVLLSSLPLIEQMVLSALGPALGLSQDNTGLGFTVPITSPFTLEVDELRLDPAGLNAHIAIDGLDATHPISTTLLGFSLALTAFDLTLANSGLQSVLITGKLGIPLFSGTQTVDVEVSVLPDSSITITLAADQDPSVSTPDGLAQLNYDFGSGISITLTIATLELVINPGSVSQLILSGKLLAVTPGLSWPTIEFKKLSIGSNHQVSLDGGWIDLPEHTAIDFFDFHIGLQKVGFGSDGDPSSGSSSPWLGFNGDIHLDAGLPLSGSVRGLKIPLGSGGSVSLDSISVSFTIPDVLTLSGEVDIIHANTTDDLTAQGLSPTLPLPVSFFAGQVDVVITAAGGLEVDAQLIVGHFAGHEAFYLALDVELPVGIVIFPFLSLYGIHGMFASNFRPDPTRSSNTWWEWYKYPFDNGKIATNESPDYTLTDVNKWLNYPLDGAFALGAGVTVGTSDDGFTVSAAVTFALILPGPVIALVGNGNILSKRISGATAEGSFDAMAVYDGGAGSFDLNLHAHYEIPVVLTIEADAALHIARGSGWFFAMGLPPHEKRVRARVFDIFEVNTYFVVSDSGLITGSYVGYQHTWGWDVLNLSINAYLATILAIQWSPIQIGGGLEIHGELHVDVFGLGFGLTADVLLEGGAPHPFWVHGELHVDLSLPWPIPDIHANVGLTWGGDDGTLPPAPLPLAHVDATLIDHMSASDHYTLLSHKPPPAPTWTPPPPPWPAPDPDTTANYDNAGPGLLDLNQPAPNRSPGDFPPTDPKTAAAFAQVIPQDAHLALSFVQSTNDPFALAAQNGATGSGPFNQTAPAVALPSSSLIPPDDMSNLNLNPPAPSVQWSYQNSLVGVELYQYTSSTTSTNGWDLVAGLIQPPASAAPTPLIPPAANPPEANSIVNVPDWSNAQPVAAWIKPQDQDPNPQPNDPSPKPNTQIKITPFQLLGGPTLTVQWAAGTLENLGLQFSEQLLAFVLDPKCSAVTVSGGALSFNTNNAQNPITIHFPVPAAYVEIVSFKTSYSPPPQIAIRAQAVPAAGSSGPVLLPPPDPPVAPVWQAQGLGPSGGVVTLAPPAQITTIPPNSPIEFSQTTVSVPASTPWAVVPITQISLQGNPSENDTVTIYQVTWSPYIKMGILPASPALFALKTVTQIKPGRVGDGGIPAYENATTIVEYAYFQTAAGPGAGQLTSPPATTPPQPIVLPPLLALAQISTLPASTPGQPSPVPTAGAVPGPSLGNANSVFPVGGKLNDLKTYMQWSWPQNGDLSAYYGYWLNVEFNETYVNALYLGLPGVAPGDILNGLHFHCVDRNSNHVLILPQDLHVPSFLTQSALVGAVVVPQPLRSPPPPPPPPPPPTPTPTPVPKVAWPSLPDLNVLHLSGSILVSDPTLSALWPGTLQPRTQYTLDLLAGPFVQPSTVPGTLFGFLLPGMSDTDRLSALKAYYAFEDGLTANHSLLTIQFATSRYATFTDHLSNAVSMWSLPGGSPGAVRSYQAANNTNPLTWLAVAANTTARTSALTDYQNARTTLQSWLWNFDPMADELIPPDHPASLSGVPALRGAAILAWQTFAAANAGQSGAVVMRGAVELMWQAFTAATSSTFDALITALGRSDLASNQAVAAPPVTEVSTFVDGSGNVLALLLESPEPLLWRRLWNWIAVGPDAATAGNLPSNSSAALVTALWSLDGTRALLVPSVAAAGPYFLTLIFQYNIGAEAPAIMNGLVPDWELAAFGPLTLAASPAASSSASSQEQRP